MPPKPGAGSFTVGAQSPGGALPDINAGLGNTGPVLNVGGGSGLSIPPAAAAIYDLARFALLNGSKPFAVAQTSTAPLVDQPPSWRNFLHFRNASGSGGANLYINFGDVAAIDGSGIAGSGFKLAPDEQILFDAVVPQDDIYAIADAAGGLLVISYSVIAIPGA